MMPVGISGYGISTDYSVYNHADADDTKKVGRTSSPEECQTCKNRKYRTVPMKMYLSNLPPMFHRMLPVLRCVLMKANMYPMLFQRHPKKTAK